MNNNIAKPKGKIIRDAVHGDIFIPDKFLKIVDTPEFQRLRRIRQLSTASMLFPTAEHTRFSHSIGCYYVMNLLIEHFRPILGSIKVKIDDIDIDLALAAALLHDIGHGPFSHAFENALPNNKKQKKHEQWTTDIITSEESEIQKSLTKYFGAEFPRKLADLISKDRQIEKNGIDRQRYTEIDLFFVVSSLISSQLDADRMDYLLRDSYFTGVPYGSFDISRLINSLTLTVSNDQYYVCTQEKYLSTIEDYVLARYQMHNGIYLHKFKCEMELVIRKILYRAFELFNDNRIDKDDLPAAIRKTFEGKDVSVTDYVALDDSVLLFLFSKWKNSSDQMLSVLSSTLLDRKKFRCINILDNKRSDIDEFKGKLKELLISHGCTIGKYEDEYFWIQDSFENAIYKKSKENIWVLKNDGTLKDLMDVSKLITHELKEKQNIVFMDLNILRQGIKKEKGEAVVEDINNLISLFNKRNQIEIEKKYVVVDPQIFDKVRTKLNEYEGYKVHEAEKPFEQVDTYYDTENGFLNKKDITLRIRKKKGKIILTIKTPTVRAKDTSTGTQSTAGQSERFEYEKELERATLEEARNYITKYIPDMSVQSKFNQLKAQMVIKTKRTKMQFSGNDNIKFEIAFDDVRYKRRDKSAHEYEIEMELKSDFIHRINLKMVTDYLESNLSGLSPTRLSKYKRGLNIIDNKSHR